jgi:TonB family protein
LFISRNTPADRKEFTKFLYSHLRYPKEALTNRIEGVVYMEYDIDNKGTVVATRVLKGLGYGCDERGCPRNKNAPFYSSQKQGIHVLFHQKVRVKFKLPEEKPVQVPAPQQQQPVKLYLHRHYHGAASRYTTNRRAKGLNYYLQLYDHILT